MLHCVGSAGRLHAADLVGAGRHNPNCLRELVGGVSERLVLNGEVPGSEKLAVSDSL